MCGTEHRLEWNAGVSKTVSDLELTLFLSMFLFKHACSPWHPPQWRPKGTWINPASFIGLKWIQLPLGKFPDYFLYAVCLKSFWNSMCIYDLEVSSWLAVFLMLLRGANRALSTRNRLPNGCRSFCVSFPYIEYSFATHVLLFCYVAVAYFRNFQGNNLIKFCFRRHIFWADAYKRTKHLTRVHKKVGESCASY